MLIYKKTYENYKTKGTNFPVEDKFWANENVAIVADGITRDPVLDLSTHSFQEMVLLYPRPSGASLASQTICETFQNDFQNKNLFDLLVEANENVAQLNKSRNLENDYLINDYYGAVASAIRIMEKKLEYIFVCDCGVIVYNKNGEIRFQTVDEMGTVNQYFDMGDYSWHQPEARALVREKYRNNPSEPNSFGALTGEKTAINYFKTGQIDLETGDFVIVYSDGFRNYFKRQDFFECITSFDAINFDSYVESLAKYDYEAYGSEKTLVLYRVQ